MNIQRLFQIFLKCESFASMSCSFIRLASNSSETSQTHLESRLSESIDKPIAWATSGNAPLCFCIVTVATIAALSKRIIYIRMPNVNAL